MFVKKLNPDASDTNTLVIEKSQSGCCGSGTNLEKCQYSIDTLDFSAYISNGGIGSFDVIDENGLTTNLKLSTPVIVVSELKDSIISAVNTIGYILDDDPRGVVIKDLGGGNISIDIYGELEFVRVYDADESDDDAFTKKCNTKVISDYSASFGSINNNPVLSVDGTTSTITGTFAIDASGATALQTALASALTGEQSVSVAYDAVNGALDVVVVYDVGSEIILDAKVLNESNVRSIYTV